MAKLAKLDIDLEQRRIFSIADDFIYYVDTQMWTKSLATGGSAAASASGYGGTLSIGSGTTQYNDCYVHSTNKPFLFGQDQPLIAEARVKWTEASTNQAGFVFGVASVGTTGGNLLNSTGTGLVTSFSGAVIFKVPGTAQWQTCSSLSTTQTITKVNTQDPNGNPTDGNYHTLRVEFKPITSTLAEVTYFIDNQQLRGTTTPTAVMGIVDQLTYTSAAAMYVVVGNQCGTTSAETLLVDYIVAEQIRYASGVYA